MREARGSFLSLIPDLRPHVIGDLWSTTFFDFVFALAELFKKELVGDATKIKSGEEVFLHLLVCAMHEQSAEPWLIDRVNAALIRTLGHFHKLDQQQVREAIPDWKTLQRRKKTGELRKKLQEWSTKWNLDAEWCCDHALSVLRCWLFDEPLRWTFIDPDPDPPNVIPTRESRLTVGWKIAGTGATADVLWSRVGLTSQVYEGGDPAPFKCRGFEAAGWNFLRERAEYKRQVELDFRIYCLENELTRLTKLKEREARHDQIKLENYQIKLENDQTGALREFNRELDNYLSKLEQERIAAATKHNLVAAPPAAQSIHFEWLILYQVPQTNLTCLSCPQIRKRTNKAFSEVYIRKCVAKTANLIGLRLRDRHMHAGRPRGTGRPISHRVTH